MSLIEKLTKEEITETPMIDIMYHYLRDERQPVDFYTLMDKIAEYKGWTKKQKESRLVQAYTDMNIDGRFVALGDNQWGLKGWYPVEQTDEELVTTIKPKKKKKKKEDDFDDYDELIVEEELEVFEDEVDVEDEEDEEEKDDDETLKSEEDEDIEDLDEDLDVDELDEEGKLIDEEYEMDDEEEEEEQ